MKSELCSVEKKNKKTILQSVYCTFQSYKLFPLKYFTLLVDFNVCKSYFANSCDNSGINECMELSEFDLGSNNHANLD